MLIPDHAQRCRGFTLIEAMATTLVLAVLGSISSFLLVTAVDGLTAATISAQLHGEVSVALDRAVREIRKIGLDTAASDTAPNVDSVTQAGTEDDIQWKDSDGDNYRLRKNGSDLLLQVDNGSEIILLADVTAFAVSIYDEDNAVISGDVSGTGCDPIRRVVLEVTVTRNGMSQTLRGRVFLRTTMSGS